MCNSFSHTLCFLLSLKHHTSYMLHISSLLLAAVVVMGCFHQFRDLPAAPHAIPYAIQHERTSEHQSILETVIHIQHDILCS